MDQRSSAPVRGVSALVLLGIAGTLSLAGCGSINSSFGTLMEPERIDYKSATAARTKPTLEVPPDLTQLQRENRYALPESARGTATATASGFNAARSETPAVTGPQVAPKASAEMRIERAGNQRWLVVKQSPEVLWPQLKTFWQDNGFLINLDDPAAGIMETDWAENRAKIPQDFLRRTLGKVLDSLYSTGERDKFRTRLERNPDGSTEIYISHRGAQEQLTGLEKSQTVWTPRAPEPDLEADFVSRLAARLSSDDGRAKAQAATAAVATAAMPQAARAKLVGSGSAGYVEVDEAFDRAWRRVGLALDRVGFTVEDRDRNKGVYFVRYVDQDQDAKDKEAAERGFLSKMFSSSKSDKAKTAQQYQVSVKGVGEVSQVAVLNKEGRPETSATGPRILGLLNEQLK